MNYLMTIDAGTGSVRAVIFDTNGKEISISQKEWTHKSEDNVPGSMNFDYKEGWNKIISCIKEAILKAKIDPKNILAVTATSMREGIVLYDKNGEEIWAVANVDSRAKEEVTELKEKFPSIEEEFYKISGQTFALGALARLLWLKKNRPEIYEKSSKISMISDWVLKKLSGVIASEPSNAGTTGIFSLKRRDWEPQMAKKVGLKSDIFPPVLESGEVLGKVTKEASLQTSLSLDTLVVMGGGDVQMASLGLGIVKADDTAIIGGSFWQQVVNMDKPLVASDMSIRVNPHVIKGISQAEGITFFSGLIMRWFRDAFCLMEKMEAKKIGVDAYELLEEMASRVPVGSYGIIPIFSDEMNYGRWYHAAPSFLNLSIDPTVCNKASMFRSLEENAAIVSAKNLDKISLFTGSFSEKLVFAGGASKGFLWPKILSDVTARKVKIPVVKEATSLGGAIAAGVGAGVFEDMQSASKKLVKFEKIYNPDMENHKIYKEIAKKWERAYKKQLELVDEKVTESMWRAPGI